MRVRVLDCLADPAGWLAVASGEAQLTITAEPFAQSAPGGALRLDFDFRGGGGFVVARRVLALSLPESYTFRFNLRGECPPNTFEFKLADPANVNVWRYREPALDLTDAWRTIEIKGRSLDFAWGPAGGGAPREVGALEFAIVAGPGGRGTVWISDLCLVDRTVGDSPTVSASTHRPRDLPAAALDGRPDTCWCPLQSDPNPTLTIDFHAPREYGGLRLRWMPAAQGCAFRVAASEDGATWRTLYAARRAEGQESLVYLPRGESRLLRLDIKGRDGAPPPGLTTIEVLPDDASRSLSDWFHTLAQGAPRGRYPRWLYREQTYWTPVNIPDGGVAGLLNEDGLVELDLGSCALEPFLYVDSRLIAWSDCVLTQTLEQGELPIPSVVWQHGDLRLTTTCFATGRPGDVLLWVRYRIANLGQGRCAPRLFAALRPVQVTPPWQAHQGLGGLSPVGTLAWQDGALWVNAGGVDGVDRGRALVPLQPVAGAGVTPYDEGPITDYLAQGLLPAAIQTTDGFGYASGALAFDLDLPPGGQADIYLVAPQGPVAPGTLNQRVPEGLSGPAAFAQALAQWSGVLGQVRFDLPASARAAAQAAKTAIAHVLINRDGPALQPGPRRYTRSWIRDGAVMGAALLRFGCPDAAAGFIRWYAQFQRADGNVPCCVDRNGVDWLPEHDSHGEFIFAVAEYHRFTGDLGLARDLWPRVQKAVGYLETLRAERLTDEYRNRERCACFGLLPESVSHEGYLAQPVHAYWDDFWALRGFKDASYLAEALGDLTESTRLAALADDFRTTLLDSIDVTMATRGIDFLPGSVEWADADPTAVANTLTLIDESHELPAAPMARTFEIFMERFRAMHGGGAPWTNYTPYEIRIIGALVRLGWRREAHELLDFHLAERRPPAWNQWPEIAWADPRSPGHQGDLPHAWIGAEFALVFRDLFAYEREADHSLVVGAGIPEHWLAAGPVAVTGLPTAYGRLDLRLVQRGDGGLTLDLRGDLRLPPGGIQFVPPGAGREFQVLVNGAPTEPNESAEIAVANLPAVVTLSGWT